ncbi:MAG TPA: hypothetical protein P5567_14985 [Kiritimatiellia bacterium]|nr:hypothetical protein [Kiritimatiellia bacterium]HSA19346.1 hypothetical protein [Kiritimatiellia bacterium]
MRKRSCGLIVVMILFMASHVLESTAQPPPPAASRPVDIRAMKGGKAITPQYQLLKGQAMARTREWFQILTQYETDPEWMDELTFTYYVLVRDKVGPQKGPVLFRGDVTYVTIQEGKHMSDMYLHPSTLARYGEVEAVAVLVTFRGQLVAMESQPASNQRWWEQLAPVEGFLLNRMQTPFAMIDFDNYEAIKPGAAGGR